MNLVITTMTALSPLKGCTLNDDRTDDKNEMLHVSSSNQMSGLIAGKVITIRASRGINHD